jgi:hypothetical protein
VARFPDRPDAFVMFFVAGANPISAGSSYSTPDFVQAARAATARKIANFFMVVIFYIFISKL